MCVCVVSGSLRLYGRICATLKNACRQGLQVRPHVCGDECTNVCMYVCMKTKFGVG